MRTKEPCYLITFSSTSAAIQFEKEATARHLPGRLIPLPPVISAGCGMAWKIKKQEVSDLPSIRSAFSLSAEEIYELFL